VEIQTPRFRVGWIVITPGALVALVESHEDPKTFVYRHIQGDWGEIGPDGWADNEYALRHGEQLFSAYQTRHGRKLWVVTEGNRYATTILLPPEKPEGKEIPCEQP
jgi:hypothetical protein